jgi:hypothetical protein
MSSSLELIAILPNNRDPGPFTLAAELTPVLPSPGPENEGMLSAHQVRKQLGDRAVARIDQLEIGPAVIAKEDVPGVRVASCSSFKP